MKWSKFHGTDSRTTSKAKLVVSCLGHCIKYDIFTINTVKLYYLK
uniref:Uncharacterized protein n=1 Tax=Arundo donax TaxID=35708 RepID=A0A0A9H8C3_ARUDO